jgi:hypothetical protein
MFWNTNMEAQHLSNTTTKQVIDATRAFRELVAARRNLQRLGGSICDCRSPARSCQSQLSILSVHAVYNERILPLFL